MEFLLANPFTAIAGLLSLIIVLTYYYTTCKPTPMAPEAKGAWPILGHLHMFREAGQLLHVTLGAMADKYGPAFTIRLGVRRVLVVSSWELAKEIFTVHDVVASSRPKLRATKHLGYNYVMFAFTPYGPYWQNLRKIISLELLSQRRLELLKHIRLSEIDTSISELYKFCKGNSHVSVEMKKWFGDLTLNVILRMVTGKRYNFSSATAACDHDHIDLKEARRCQKVFRDFFHFLGVSVLGDAFPFLGWLDIGGSEKAMKQIAKEMDAIFGEWLEEHRLRKDAQDDQQDFMDVLLSFLEGSEIAHHYDVDIIVKSACLMLIAGGTDTTNVMLTWTLSLLMNNLHVLDKAQKELDSQVGREKRVTESDINHLVYLQAIVKEALRLYPAGPLGGPREFTADCTIGLGSTTYHVPKGTWLLVNIWKLQRDPNVWSDPNEFRPERFLNKDIDVKGQHFELIPFGAGRRNCPGAAFALQLLHLVLANLLQCFQLFTPNNEPTDLTECAGLTNSKATPLNILISPRLDPSLY